MTNYLLSNLDVIGVKRWQTARLESALPAAGAFDSAPIEMYCSEKDTVTFYGTYTRGAEGGEVVLRVQFSPHAEDVAGNNWFIPTLYDADDVTAGANSVSLVQAEDFSYTATSGSAESFVYGPIRIDTDAQRCRVIAAENDAQRTPGTLEIIAKYN